MENVSEKNYTVKQAVEKTRFSTATITKACKNGELQTRQVPDNSKYGFHYLIPESELNKWSAMKRANASEPKSITDIAALLTRMMKEEYERGVKDGKNEAKRALNDAMRGV